MIILMYHDVTAASAIRSRFSVCVDDFRSQMNWLVENGYQVIPLSEFSRSIAAGEPIRERAVVITFDDGNEGQLRYAFPVITNLGMRATFFVSTSFVGRFGYMRWDDLQDLANAGMEIGSHGSTHRLTALLSDEELIREMDGSRAIVESTISRKVPFFSVPRGSLTAHDEARVERCGRAVGYEHVLTSNVAPVGSSGARYLLPRIAVTASVKLSDFSSILAEDPQKLARLRRASAAKEFVKRSIGLWWYEAIRALIFPAEYRDMRRQRRR